MSDKKWKAYNPDVVAHLVNGNEYLIRATSPFGPSPGDKQLLASLAAAEFAAATAKATAMAVFDTDVNAAVEAKMFERHERRLAARERMGR